MKKILAIVLAVVLLFACCACDNSNSGDTFVVGAILVGDESEGYTLAHMDGIEKAIEKLRSEGIKVELKYEKRVPESSEVNTRAVNLVAQGADVIIANSYGHQFNFGSVIEENPDVTFVSMTGDLAASSGLANYKNAFTKVYESRYVSGVVAGLKLKELVEAGKLTDKNYDGENIKIGYVGAYAYAEVVSGYTAFYLGLKSIVPNITMTVKYTNSWFSEEREAAVGSYLMEQGCVIIGQHADSTGAPAAIQDAYNKDNSLVCYSVGYNVPMLDVAPDISLTSASNNWDVYYYELFKALISGESVPTDWAKGYDDNAVCITELGKSVAEGTQAKVDETIAAIKDGFKVFNTANFTVKGEQITTFTLNDTEAILKDGEVSYFSESTIRSAPYFSIRIDGIKEIDSEYEAE